VTNDEQARTWQPTPDVIIDDLASLVNNDW
jgi:hypothetical protein